MTELGTFTPSDTVTVKELSELIDDLEDNGYKVEEDWKNGEVEISTRENQTLTESTEKAQAGDLS